MKKLKNNPLIFILTIALLTINMLYIQYILKFIGKIILILNPIIFGFCIAFILNIPLKIIEDKWLKNLDVGKSTKRSLSVILLLSIIVLLIILFVNIIIPNISSTLILMKNDIPIYFKNVNKFLSQFIKQTDIKLNSLLNIPNKITFEGLLGFLKAIKMQNLLSSMIGATTSVISIVINFSISFIFSIYVLMSKETLKKYTNIIAIVYLKESLYKKLKHIYILITDTFSKFFVGQFIDACLLGIICYIVMSLTNIPYASMICLMIAITALIPIIGAFIGSIFGFILIVFISPLSAILFIVEFIIIQQIDNHLIYPNVVGKSIGIEAIFVMVAIIIGGGIAGPIGMLIAVPTMSIIYHLVCEDIQNKKKNKVQVV